MMSQPNSHILPIERLHDLEMQFNKMEEIFKTRLGIHINDEECPNVQITQDNFYEVDLLDEIQDITSFSSILETLNQEGALRGYGFKKGPVKQKKEKRQLPKQLLVNF